jgi:hypothetical protein
MHTYIFFFWGFLLFVLYRWLNTNYIFSCLIGKSATSGLLHALCSCVRNCRVAAVIVHTMGFGTRAAFVHCEHRVGCVRVDAFHTFVTLSVRGERATVSFNADFFVFFVWIGAALRHCSLAIRFCPATHAMFILHEPMIGKLNDGSVTTQQIHRRPQDLQLGLNGFENL